MISHLFENKQEESSCLQEENIILIQIPYPTKFIINYT